MRALLRRFALGHGPLKRTTDRLHVLSRLVVLASFLASAPVAVAVASTVSAVLHATADREAAARSQQPAILLADAPDAASRPMENLVVAPATWTAPDGRQRTGDVLAPSGTRAGGEVRIWLDARGSLTTEPLRPENIPGQATVAAVSAALGLPSLAALLHLLVVGLLDRARSRRWTAEWASVEPAWAGRSG